MVSQDKVDFEFEAQGLADFYFQIKAPDGSLQN